MSRIVARDLEIPQDHLELLGCIGQGGYGDVWKAKWNGNGGGIVVAVKKIPVNTLVTPKYLEQVATEVDVLAKLRHPNIISIYGACFTPTELLIVMELIEGGNLFDLLHSDALLDWNTRLQLAHQAALALNVLHSKYPPIIHRDIKSLNYLVAVNYDMYNLKLIDFGMSKFASLKTVTPSGREALGTTRWAAPETFGNPPKWTTKADIYSLGITFYEIATLKIPFEEIEGDLQVMYNVQMLKFRPELPDECPESFADIINKCWGSDPAARPSITEVLQMLDAARQGILSDIPEYTASSCSTLDTQLVYAKTYNRFAKAEKVTKFAPHTEFNEPYGIIWNPNDECFYMSGGGNSLKKLTIDGDLSLFAENIPKTSWGAIALNIKENVFYITSANRIIYRINSKGEYSIFVGSGKMKCEDGIGTSASLQNPRDITIDQETGMLYITDCHRIRSITPDGKVASIAGSDGYGHKDGKGSEALFWSPIGIWFDKTTSTLLVCDLSNHQLRRVTLDGVVTSLCRIGESPRFIVITENGSIFATANYVITRIDLQENGEYQASILAGNGERDSKEGNPENCSFVTPKCLAVHEESHSLFVVDSEANSICRITFSE